MRKISIAAALLFAVAGLAAADTANGIITKVEKDKVTFSKTTFNKDDMKLDVGKEETIILDKGVKYFKEKAGTGGKGKKAEKEDATADDLSSAVEKAGKAETGLKGARVIVEFEEKDGKKTASSITIRGGGKGKDKKKKDQ